MTMTVALMEILEDRPQMLTRSAGREIAAYVRRLETMVRRQADDIERLKILARGETENGAKIRFAPKPKNFREG